MRNPFSFFSGMWNGVWIDWMSPSDYREVSRRGLWRWVRIGSTLIVAIPMGWLFITSVSLELQGWLGFAFYVMTAQLGLLSGVAGANWIDTLIWRRWGNRSSSPERVSTPTKSGAHVRGVVNRTAAYVLKGGHWLGHLLPRKAREKFYNPSHWDIVDDWLETRGRGIGVRCWMLVCIVVQIALNFANSLIRGVLAGVIDVFRPGI